MERQTRKTPLSITLLNQTSCFYFLCISHVPSSAGRTCDGFYFSDFRCGGLQESESLLGQMSCPLFLNKLFFKKCCHFIPWIVFPRVVHPGPRAACTAVSDGSECTLLSTPNQELFCEQNHGRERNSSILFHSRLWKRWRALKRGHRK